MRSLATSFGHMGGACDLKFIVNGESEHLLTAGSDCMTIVRGVDPSRRTAEIDGDTAEVIGHEDGITVVAACPKGERFATASEDRSVRVYSYPSLEFESLATRFTLPVRALAFHPDGIMLAAAGDDACIRVVNVSEGCSVVHTLPDLPAGVRSLMYDPKGDYLAASLVNGTVLVLDVDDGLSTVQTLEAAAPEVDVTEYQTNAACWVPPLGELLAVPHRSRGVALYSAAQKFQHVATFAQDDDSPESPVALAVFSPNGRYALTACRDGQLCLWDLTGARRARELDRLKLGAAPCALAWHPSANTAAAMDCDGQYAVWNRVVPVHLTCAVSTSPAGSGAAGGGKGAAPSYGFVFEQDHEEEERGAEDDAFNEEVHLDSEDEARDLGGKGGSRSRGGSGRAPPSEPALAVQSPIQPGSTPAGHEEGSRRYLAYSMLGYITTREEATNASVDVGFHDTSRQGGRVKAMMDYYGFTLGALGDQGAAYASQLAEGKLQSTLMYRPFKQWASNSDWTVHMPEGEEILGVAVGSSWVAATTSRHQLRLFTAGGIQSLVTTMEGQPVAVVGRDNWLACVWVAGAPTPAGRARGRDVAVQNLCYALWDVTHMHEATRGRLPLGPGATLTWLGFSEEGLLASGDSLGVVRVRVSELGGAWVPMFDAKTVRQGGSEAYWVVGLDQNELHCIVCKESLPFPVSAPRPLLSGVKLKMPLVAGTDATGGELEETFLRTSLVHAQDNLFGTIRPLSGHDKIQKKVDLDKSLLKMFHGACKADLLVRARELAERMNLHKSLNGALKIANSLRLTSLAERVQLLVQSMVTAPPPEPTYSAPSSQQTASQYSSPIMPQDKTAARAAHVETTTRSSYSLDAQNSENQSQNANFTEAKTPENSLKLSEDQDVKVSGPLAALKRKLEGMEAPKPKRPAMEVTNPSTPVNPFARKP